MHHGWLRCAWLLVLILLVPASITAAEAPDPQSADLTASVSLARSATTVERCNTVTVDIRVNDVVSLYGADVRIQYDPTLLRVVDQDAYTEGTQIQPLGGFLKPDFVIRKVACNALDAADELCNEPAEVGVVWYAATQMNPTPPVSGSGVIARITFRAAGAGLSSLTFTYSKLSDREGVQLSNTETDSELNVLPLAGPAVRITKQTASVIRLGWIAVTDAAHYRIYRAQQPYFAPADPTFGQTTGLSYEDPNALGSTAQEYYYIVKAACPDGFTGTASNRTGAFDYDLVAGQTPAP
jgi:hypothetical protein